MQYNTNPPGHVPLRSQTHICPTSTPYMYTPSPVSVLMPLLSGMGFLPACTRRSTIDDLKQFRQVGSKTPGHPENHSTAGIEVSTGPLGQGISNAVGLAIAESHLAATYNKPGFDIVDHYTYVICGDGCLQEGVSAETGSLAGHLKLGKLIVLYDDNKVQPCHRLPPSRGTDPPSLPCGACMPSTPKRAMCRPRTHASVPASPKNTDIVHCLPCRLPAGGLIVCSAAAPNTGLTIPPVASRLLPGCCAPQIQIDGSTDLAFTEDVLKRYEAYGWHTQTVADGDGREYAC